MLNRRRYMSGASGLPYDAQVEYLETDGTSYIDTGIEVVDYRTFTMECKVYASGDDFRHLAGVRTATSGNAFTYTAWMLSRNTSQIYQFALTYNNTTYVTRDTSAATTAVLKVDGIDLTFSVNGSDFAITDMGDLSIYGSIWLGRWHRIGHDPTTTASSRWYYCKMWRNGVLIQDLIPVRKNGVGYMYDRVSGVLFGNAGGGAFTYGEDV